MAEDRDIVALYPARDEAAIAESERRYGAECRRIAERMDLLDGFYISGSALTIRDCLFDDFCTSPLGYMENDPEYDPADYYEAVMKGGAMSGRQYLLPLSFDINLYSTTEELLAKNGIDPAELNTWDVFFDACAAFHENNPGKPLFSWNYNRYYLNLGILLQTPRESCIIQLCNCFPFTVRSYGQQRDLPFQRNADGAVLQPDLRLLRAASSRPGCRP